ncbi:MAG: single-stranded-DNA-specific exonuclease RecJ [Spirochaetes bacterium RBG_13_51_14]|nr:MAG: single-stranded-DNA-specific exonuclease RecJ [Spirochaetes bacterium RBG_13_51_14]
MKPEHDTHETDRRLLSRHSTHFGLHPAIVGILHSRGYDTFEKIDSFLNPRISDIHSPFLLDGMFSAVARLRKAIESGERIGIFADSDLDGITSLAVLHYLFARMKIDPFIRYLRDDENYGMTREIIDEFARGGVTLLITVDAGIRDVTEVAHARSLGIDVIVTDHHEQDSELPDAIIINPKKTGCRYPFKYLAGVGVAFKLCHAFLLSYLPSFNARFIVITGSGAGCSVSQIRNCVVEMVEEDFDVERASSLIREAGSGDIVLLHIAPRLAETVTTDSGGKKIYDFTDFINMVRKTKDATIKDFCADLKINMLTEQPDIHILNSIVLSTQFAGSDKIVEFMESVIGLVSIGSIADVVSLIGENRILVKNGLESLRRSKHAALSMLINGETINSRTIGWVIAPLLNTPGRLGKTYLTVRFFIEKDKRVLKEVISEIKVLNESRRNFINQFCARILSDLKCGSIDSSGRLIYIKTDEIPEGYAGLIANRIADTMSKPVIVAVTPGKNGTVKGSGRSREGVRFFSAAEQFRDRFERIGGHENAFGFTAGAGEIDDIIHSIDQILDDYSAPVKRTSVEGELDVSLINAEFIDQLERLEPFGGGNPEPVFITRNLSFESFVIFGNNHGKFTMAENISLSAVGWGMGSEMKEYFNTGRPLDIVYRLGNNNYNGNVSSRMTITEIRYSGD